MLVQQKFMGNTMYEPRHSVIKCEFYNIQHMWTDGVHSILKIIHDLSAALTHKQHMQWITFALGQHVPKIV